MKTLDTKQNQATSKFGQACKALVDNAAKQTTLVNGLIAACILVAKAYADKSVTFADLRLSAYRHMGFSTYSSGGMKTFLNVYTGKVEQCMPKGQGKSKTSTATAVQEALARIAAACDTDLVSELLGYTDKSGAEIAPTVGDLREFKKSVSKHDKQAEAPAKVVGQIVNAPKPSNWDMSKLETQLARIQTALADCDTQEVVNQFTTDIRDLANLICELVGIEDEIKRAKAIDTRHSLEEPVKFKTPEKQPVS